MIIARFEGMFNSYLAILEKKSNFFWYQNTFFVYEFKNGSIIKMDKNKYRRFIV
jgi:hypothetical protein